MPPARLADLPAVAALGGTTGASLAPKKSSEAGAATLTGATARVPALKSDLASRLTSLENLAPTFCGDDGLGGRVFGDRRGTGRTGEEVSRGGASSWHYRCGSKRCERRQLRGLRGEGSGMPAVTPLRLDRRVVLVARRTCVASRGREDVPGRRRSPWDEAGLVLLVDFEFMKQV